MSKRKDAKTKPTKMSPDEIFDGLRNPDNENVFLVDGKIDGNDVVFVASERSNGDVVPIALLLDKAAFSTLHEMEEELSRREEDGDEDDEDGDDEDEDGFEP